MARIQEQNFSPNKKVWNLSKPKPTDTNNFHFTGYETIMTIVKYLNLLNQRDYVGVFSFYQ
jgi:hypothetical protein